MFFTDMEGNFLSEFHVGDLRPSTASGRVLLRAHGHGRHGHQARPARQRLVHGRSRRDRLQQADASEGDRVLRPGGELGHLVRVPVHGPDVQEGARDSRLRVGRRHEQRPRAGHGRVPDDRREARQARDGRPPQPADDGLTAFTPCESWGLLREAPRA